jgi:hypothetical protein
LSGYGSTPNFDISLSITESSTGGFDFGQADAGRSSGKTVRNHLLIAVTSLDLR